jgi:hypothetical protein
MGLVKHRWNTTPFAKRNSITKYMTKFMNVLNDPNFFSHRLVHCSGCCTQNTEGVAVSEKQMSSISAPPQNPRLSGPLKYKLYNGCLIKVVCITLTAPNNPDNKVVYIYYS